MSELINGRTPEEIKRGLRCNMAGQHCNFCSYQIECISETGDPLAIDRDALALIERLESEREAALAKVPKWISVEDRPPECPCLYWDGNNRVRVAEEVTSIELTSGKTVYLTNVTFDMLLGIAHSKEGWDDCTHILYWMPLPEPPEGDAR